MPLYDYKCTKCGHTVEVRHGFSESYDQPCPQCGAPLQRVINPAPIIFKGSGFYVTDSRKSQAKTESKTESKPETKTESKPESKPEAKKDSGSGESAA